MSSSRARRAAGSTRARRARPRRHTSVAAACLAVLGALLPGTAYLVARRFRLGTAVTLLSLAGYAAAAYVGLKRRDDVIAWALDPTLLLWMVAGLAAVALLWVVVLVTSYKMLRPLAAGPGARMFGSLVIGLVCFGMAASTAMGAETLMAQRSLVQKVFGGEESKSQTRPTITAKKNVWDQLPRLNILLLGADDGADRDGARTDTVIVASIDTKTGDTALISLTRNFMRMPFPADSPLHEKYPTGFWDPKLGDTEQSNFYLDAMYRMIPQKYPGILGPSDNEGADVLKVSVGEAVGLKLHYYVQINVIGFSQLVQALGGIKVNINYPVPVGGDDDKKIPPSRYLQPGPDRELGGFDAMWFARGRYRVPGADLARQARQRCTIKAIVERATPQNVLANYQSIAKAGEQLIRTDIPQKLLPEFVTLGQRVKSAKITNIDLDKKKNFPNGRNPNYAGMREIIKRALNPAAAPKPHPTTTAPSRKSTGKPTTTKTTPGDLADDCAYHPTS
ncbi:LytR family transcriptional regulator [Kribbella capetownensis]|uniref:LytR family transcriptional regulator n=1 Tax=Kribbella capetownensis TaxID=1572659 RepID=A0A4R0JZR4_9ACTN|nr:LCP family protein [Kribbella capetownensis]TCC53101.1 LytR family transcriptional regulator [Kribbella capetownensis]